LGSLNLKAKIVDELHKIADPETSMDVISIGLVKEVTVTPENRVRIALRPSSPVCPMAFYLAFQIKEKIKMVPGVEELEITVIDYQKADELNELLRD